MVTEPLALNVTPATDVAWQPVRQRPAIAAPTVVVRVRPANTGPYPSAARPAVGRGLRGGPPLGQQPGEPAVVVDEGPVHRVVVGLDDLADDHGVIAGLDP